MKPALLLCVPLLLAACGSPPVPPPAADREGDDVIGEPLHRSLDEARSVEDLGGERKGGIDEAVDEAN